ncbi:MAG TPA: hypothetical protein ACFYD4_10045 [Candidatus Wunengus sp. YC61]|uniref:hypothetical protein n=1 Tax=Candidatus Wunengus sp. YC61 TaxID=3367698 RepID=UPI004026ECFE
MFLETNQKYGTGFEISEYQGKISLVAAREYNGKVYKKWGEIEIGKDKTKHLPVSVELGEGKEAAVRSLKAAIQFILADKTEKEDDVPF